MTTAIPSVEEILAQAEQERQFEKKVVDRYGKELLFMLRILKKSEIRRIAAKMVDTGVDPSSTVFIQANDQVFLDSIVGWSGPTLGHVLEKLTAEQAACPLPFSKEAASLLMDMQPEISLELSKAIKDRTETRRVWLENELKNSERTSTGQ